MWGWAKPGAEVKLTLGDIKKEIRADQDGRWQINLPPQEAGGPFEISISSGFRQQTLKDVWFGEVWLCGGQSNMQYSLNSLDKDSAIANASNEMIKVFQVPRRLAFLPQEDMVRGNWETSSPNSVEEFSAVAYFFGKKLYEELQVPIGLISSNYGGTVLETWLSPQAASTVPYYREAVESLASTRQSSVKRSVRKAYRAMRKGMGKLNEKAFQGGRATWASVDCDDSDWGEMTLPGLWDAKGLKEFDGSVWFRKEVFLEGLSEGENFTLNFGRFDDVARVWFNGEQWPRDEPPQNNYINMSIPRSLVREGKNVISVRITDTGGPGGVWGQDTSIILASEERKIDLAGKWKFRLSNDDLSLDIPGDRPNDMPTLLYNSMIQPLTPLAMRGVIWYQGESNADRGWEYQKLFRLLVEDWRRQFERELSFYFVQLANYTPKWYSLNQRTWAELREAQLQSLEIPKTGMAVAIDIGDPQDVHPANKEDVGLRLALNALAKDFGQDLTYSGPMYRSMQVAGDSIRLFFDHVGKGLAARNDTVLMGFEVAGKDKKFRPATARIAGDEIILTSPEVPQPLAARYAWKDNPEEANLINQEGLPASPFRTDDWPLDSKGKVKKYFPFKE